MTEDGNAGAEPIAFDEIAEIDLDSLDHLSDGELAGHFRELAGRATEGQLRDLLGVGHGEPGGHGELVEAYAERRLAVALKMRALRDGA